MTTEALKNCPFCGARGEVAHYPAISGAQFAPSCTDVQCPAYVVEPHHSYGTREEAAEIWDTRGPVAVELSASPTVAVDAALYSEQLKLMANLADALAMSTQASQHGAKCAREALLTWHDLRPALTLEAVHG